MFLEPSVRPSRCSVARAIGASPGSLDSCNGTINSDRMLTVYSVNLLFLKQQSKKNHASKLAQQIN